MDYDFTPKKTDENVTIFPGAMVIGDVTFGKGCSVWYNAVMRSGKPIRIGKMCNIQDNCTFHSDVTPTILGDNVVVGHGAIVHGATVGNNVLIGMGAVLLDGAVIGDNCFIAAGALVTGKMNAPEGSFIMGNPAKIVRQVTEKELQTIKGSVKYYYDESEEFKEQVNK